MSSKQSMQPIVITVTAGALQHIQTMVKQQAGIGLRLSLRKYGCNGYGYVPEVISVLHENDREAVTGTALRVFINEEDAALLTGTTIDYVKKGLSQQLQFTNPHAEGQCGCGESVNFKNNEESKHG